MKGMMKLKLKTNFIFKYLGVMMLFITLIFCNQIKAKAIVDNEKIYGAEEIDGVYVKKVRWYDNFIKYKQGEFIRRRSDNHWVYCLQPHLKVNQDASYGFTLRDYTEISELSMDQWKKIVLISFYGYGYDNHTEDKWYYITQVMIWRVAEPRSEFHFTNGLEGPVDDNLFKNEINEIQTLVDEHYTKPSFSQNTVTINKGESVVLTDNNNVLSKYDVSYSGSVTASSSGNTLTVNANNVGTGTVTLKKITSKYDTPPVLYYATSSQDVLGVGNYDPIILNYSFKVTGGDVSIHKTDDRNNTLAGVKFGVYNSKSQETCTFTTDASGNGGCNGIPLGNYTVKELETVEGYIKNETVFNFELTESNPIATLNITNEKIRGYIEIQKKDKENNNATPQGDATLKGAVYGIFDSHGTKAGELITNESGYAKSGLLDYGVYTIKELKASEGYELDTTVYSANINAPKIVVPTTSKEQVIKFDFRLLKVKSDGTSGIIDAEPNARFEIYLKSKDLLMGSITTNDKGQADFTLPYGTYEVCQVDGGSDVGKAPCFDIVIRDKDVERIVNNGLVNARLKAVKVDQDGNKLTRAGIKFKIKDLSTDNYVCQTLAYPTKETICEYETDADGILITPYPLYAGDYQLEEIDQVVDGYLWNSEPVKFTIEANGNIEFDDELGEIIELNFVNTEVLGSIEIYKIGEEVEIKDGSFTYKEIPLPNVVLGLYDSKNNFIEKYTTNENGYVKIENLKLGKYIIREIATEDNYVLDGKPYEIELKYKDQYTPIVTTTFTLKNYLKKGELDFTKSDLTDGKVIPNVKLSIYTEDNQLIFTGLTDEFGKIKITNLFTGRFYIVEEEPAIGYRLSDEKVFFEIKENGEIVKVKMTNEKIKVDVPDTDLNETNYLEFIGILTILIGIGGIACYAARRKK